MDMPPFRISVEGRAVTPPHAREPPDRSTMSRRHDAHFHEFEPHTQLKHSLLQNYLAGWVPKLSLDGRGHTRLFLVDAFAGEGADATGRPGSPLIMIEAALAGLRAVRQFRQPPEIQIALIEREGKRLRRLRENVAAYPEEVRRMVRILPGQLADHADDLLTEIGDAPMLAFFDPFGIKGLRADLVRRALEGPQHEVLLLFNGKAGERLVHAATTTTPKRLREIEASAAQAWLFDTGDEHARHTEQQRARCTEGLANASGGAHRHLAAAFGKLLDDPQWEPFLRSLTQADRVAANLVDVFAAMLKEAGAPLVTRMPVYGVNARLKYVLLHATKHPIGKQTIKEAFYAALSKSALPMEAQSRTISETFISDDELRQALTVYAGRSAPWAKEMPDSIQRHLLQRSEAFPWQIRELERDLVAGGLREPGRSKVYRFPSVGWRTSALL